MKNIIFTIIMAMVLGFSMQAHASLENLGTDSLGNQLIYDSDLNITWYDYTNSSNSWQNQSDWTTGLSVYFGGTIYDNWRLPSTYYSASSDTCDSFICTDSEMEHLYYRLLDNSTQESSLSEAGNFQNLQFDSSYWSGTENSDPNYASYFDFASGEQFDYTKDSTYYAIAVFDGNIATTVVPEPVSSILFLVGGATLVFRRLRKIKN